MDPVYTPSAFRRQELLDLPHPCGGTLQGTLSYDRRPGPAAVLYVHGFGSVRGGEKAVALEAACARRGYTFAAFDFRGHGGSSGTMLELRCGGLLADLEAAAEYLATRGVRHLFPVGSSMGGWAAAWFTLRRPDLVPACVLLAPAFDFAASRYGDLTEAQRSAWKETGRLRIQNDWLDTEVGYGLAEEVGHYPWEQLAQDVRRPLLLFHGMRDETIPYQVSLAFLERAVHPEIELRLIKNGDHRLTAIKDELAEAACAFFARWLER